LPNGPNQINAGIYDQDALENLFTDRGEDVVLLDTIVIEDSTVVEDSTAPTDDVTDSAIPFGDNIIVTYNYYIQEAISDQGDKYSLRFLWYARQTPAERLTAFVHLLDENGQVVQQQDQELAWTVAAGEMGEPGFTEYALQSVEVDLPDGRYQVQVGLYDAVSGQRVTTTQDTVEGETAVWVDEIVVGEGINAVEPAWLEMGRQDGRASSSDTLNVEAVVGYDLSGLAAGEYVLKLHYAKGEPEPPALNIWQLLNFPPLTPDKNTDPA
jgi:hypothetical protein